MRLDLKSLTVELGGRRVLDDVTLSIGEGEFVGLVGPNGAGKSTLLKAIVGLLPAGGEIALGGEAARSLSARETGRRLSYLAQEREIAWPVPVEDLVMLGRAARLPSFARPGPQDAAAVARAMRRMEVEALARRPATELSGGEKARVLIARALAQETPLLLADEPTAALDPAHQIALMRVFADLAGEGGAVVACLHDLGLAARWCTRIVLLDAGRIIADGAPLDALTPERLRSVYGVEALFADRDGPVVHPLDLAGRTPG
jgi:ABC-type cobalamin/Fe3+-siderophores transport systems, ATPase components